VDVEKDAEIQFYIICIYWPVLCFVLAFQRKNEIRFN